MKNLQNIQIYYSKKYNFDVQLLNKNKNIFCLSETIYFHLISFGRSMIFIGDKDMIFWAKENFENTLSEDIIDGSNLFKIESKLRENGYQFVGEHLRFLFNESIIANQNSNVVLEKYFKNEMNSLYVRCPDYYNALNYKDDEIALVATIDSNIVGVVGADSYSDPLWQIGIDVVEEYRGLGLATLLVQNLAKEILSMGKIPFYTTWSANIASVRTALKAGFYPAWVEYFAKKMDL